MTPLLAAALLSAAATIPPIVIDGSFDDWKGAQVVARDPLDAFPQEIDLRLVRAAHDEKAVYLELDLAHRANLHLLHGSLVVVLDADGDAATGRREHGLAGADLLLEFSPLDASGKPQAGARLRTPVGDAGWAEAHVGAAGLVVAPSYAAPRVEMAIARGVRVGGSGPLLAGRMLRGKVVYVAEGRPVDETSTFTYLLPPRPPRPAPGGDPLARAARSDFRVLSWNVSREAILRDPEPFARILAAVRPDVVILDELPPSYSGPLVADFLARAMAPPSQVASVQGAGPAPEETCVVEAPCADAAEGPPSWAAPPAGADGAWAAVFGQGGGSQRVAVATHAPLQPVAALGFVPYPEGHLRDFERGGTTGARESADELLRQGVGTGGARIRLGGRALLAAAVDLQCCGRAAGPQDRLRLVEASAIRDALRHAVAAEKPDGVILAGDFNLVGSRVPLDVVSRNLDPRGGHLAILEPLQLDGRSNATWSDPDQPFAPGRLDYMLYSPSALEVARSFVLETQDVPEEWRRRHGLQEGDTAGSSDHRPIVADFRWRRPR